MDISGSPKGFGTPSFDLGISQPLPDQQLGAANQCSASASSLVRSAAGNSTNNAPDIAKKKSPKKIERFRHKCVPTRVFTMAERECPKPNWEQREMVLRTTGFGDVMMMYRMLHSHLGSVVTNRDWVSGSCCVASFMCMVMGSHGSIDVCNVGYDIVSKV